MCTLGMVFEQRGSSVYMNVYVSYHRRCRMDCVMVGHSYRVDFCVNTGDGTDFFHWIWS